jgi:hypothetical protein
MNSYDKFYNSFKQNFGDGEEIGDDFLKTFEKIARQLDRLEVLDCAIDVGKKKRLIDFNVYLPNGIFITVCRYLDSTGQVYELEGGGEVVVDDETVFYSIEREEKTLSIGIIHLDEFIGKMLEIQRDFRELEEKIKKIQHDDLQN